MQDFERLIAQAEAKSFSGWDFSWLNGRMSEGEVSWDYRLSVAEAASSVMSMLDMGTGGGEFLASLGPLPQDTCATEAYAPNIPVARRRLKPIGVHVAEFNRDDSLPFESGRFELIINRHEAYSPTEIRRLAKSRARFITQQVGGLNEIAINQALGAPVYEEFAHWNLTCAVHELQAAGWIVTASKEEFPETHFYDIGALVYYLKIIEWQVSGFTVEGFQPELQEIHKRIIQDGCFTAKAHRFYIEAKADM